MSWWFGYRVIDPEGRSKPGRKCLSEPFATRKEAKAAKNVLKALEMELTDIFESNSIEEAERRLEIEQFSRI